MAQGQRVGILAPEEDVHGAGAGAGGAGRQRARAARAYGRRAEPETAAQALFAALRALDAEAPDVILAAGIGELSIGAAMHDRLMRAAEGRVVRV